MGSHWDILSRGKYVNHHLCYENFDLGGNGRVGHRWKKWGVLVMNDFALGKGEERGRVAVGP